MKPYNQKHKQPSPSEIALQMINDPRARWCDVVGGDVLVSQLTINPDWELTELALLKARELQNKAASLQDSFLPNYPPKGTLPEPQPELIPLLALPTGDVLSIPIRDLCRNLCVVGSTGGGKTTFLRCLIAAVLEGER